MKWFDSLNLGVQVLLIALFAVVVMLVGWGTAVVLDLS